MSAMSTGGTASDPARMVDRRAQLLEQGTGQDGATARELSELSRELGDLLDDGRASVLRVTAADPPGMAAALAPREPVHPVRDDRDLADRLAEDRRCFVVAHPALPGRPTNVVWVALTRGVPGSIQDLLDPAGPTLDPATADTAAFYSIWNAEPGLAGLGRGEELLVGAVATLRAELPGLRTFVTLSPVPGLRRWLERRSPRLAAAAAAGDPGADAEVLAACADYLTTLGDGWRPLDPVARFHLGNGARLFRLHRHGDTSERGRDRSYGVMANYRYEPEDREANRGALADGRVATSEEVEELRRRFPPHPAPA